MTRRISADGAIVALLLVVLPVAAASGAYEVGRDGASQIELDRTENAAVRVYATKNGVAAMAVRGQRTDGARQWGRVADSAAAGCTHTEDAGVCVGVFVGTVTPAHLVGCLGDVATCEDGAAPMALAPCARVLAPTAPDGAVLFALDAADDVKVMHYASARADGATTCLRIGFAPVAPASACPAIELANARRATTGDGIDLELRVPAGVPPAALTLTLGALPLSLPRTGALETSAPGWAVARWPELTIIMSEAAAAADGGNSMCVTQLDIAAAIPPFRVVVEHMLVPPLPSLLVATPTLHPYIADEGIMTVLALYDAEADGALADMAYRGAGHAPRPLSLGGCAHTHRLDVAFLTHGGNLLYTHAEPVRPRAACAARGLPLDCFCGQDGMTAAAPVVVHQAPAHAVASRPATDDAPGRLTSRFEAEEEDDDGDDDEATDGPCVAVDAATGTVFPGTGLDECTVDVPAGVYTVYHYRGATAAGAAMAVSQGRVGASGSVATNVEVCAIGRPTVERITPHGAAARASAVYVDTRLECTKARGASVHAYAPPPRVLWEHTADHAGQFAPLDGAAFASDVIWSPAPGHYRATVDWTATLGPGAVFATNTRAVGGPRAPVEAEADAEADAEAPQPCIGLEATLTAARVPRFPSDHGATAAVEMAGTPAWRGPALWAIQVRRTSPGGERDGEHWYEFDQTPPAMEIEAGVWGSAPLPRAYTFKLDAGVSYAARAMAMVRAPGFGAAFFERVCYVDAGHIDALPPVSIRVRSPVIPVECPGALVVFDVEANSPDLPVPSCGYTVTAMGPAAKESEEEAEDAPEIFVRRFVLSAHEHETPRDDLLVLTFDYGLLGAVTTHDLADIMHPGMHPSPAIASVAWSEITAGEEEVCAPSAYTVDVTVVNHTPFGYRVTVDAAAAVGVPGRGATVHTFDAVMPPPVTAPRGTPTEGRVVLDAGAASSAVARVCPGWTQSYVLPPYIQTAAALVIEPPDAAPAAALCAGKRAFRLDTGMPTPSPLAYHTLEDPDLGTTHLADGQAYLLTVGRTAPLTLHIYRTARETSGPSGTHAAETPTGCVTEIPAEAMAGHWLPPAPAVRLLSARPAAACVRPGSSPGDTPKGELLVSVGLARPGTGTPHVTLRHGDTGEPAFYAGYPLAPRDERFLFHGLAAGVYSLDATIAADGVQCEATEMLVVNGDGDDDGDGATVVDFAQTTHGDAIATCPRALLSGSGSGGSRLYYDIVLADAFALRGLGGGGGDGEGGRNVSVSVWHKPEAGGPNGVTRNDARMYKSPGDALPRRASYRFPGPGEYIAAIHVSAEEETCRYHLPPVRVREPAFDESAFIMTIDRLPTCATSSDGALRLVHPPELRAVASIAACTRWDTGAPCAAAIDMREVGPGVLALDGVPFVAVLDIEYDILGACRYTSHHRLLPPADTHPVGVEIHYTPTCDAGVQTVCATQRDPHTAADVRLRRHAGVEIAWTADGAPVGDGDGDGELRLTRDAAAAVAGADVRLRVSYRGGACESVAPSRTIVDAQQQPQQTNEEEGAIALQWPPTIAIDHLAPHEGRLSLPVHCPGAADAVLVARLDPPMASDEAAVTWAWRPHDDDDDDDDDDGDRDDDSDQCDSSVVGFSRPGPHLYFRPPYCCWDDYFPSLQADRHHHLYHHHDYHPHHPRVLSPNRTMKIPSTYQNRPSNPNDDSSWNLHRDAILVSW